jgi:hypothetical protein
MSLSKVSKNIDFTTFIHMSSNNPFYHEAGSESPISPLPNALGGLIPQVILVSYLDSIPQLNLVQIELDVSCQTHSFGWAQAPKSYLSSDIIHV